MSLRPCPRRLGHAQAHVEMRRDLRWVRSRAPRVPRRLRRLKHRFRAAPEVDVRRDPSGPPRAGLSVRTLCNPAFRGQVDGIGVYTRELWKQFDETRSVEVHPIVGFGRQFAELAKGYPNGFAFPRGFGASSLLAMTGLLPFPGARTLSERIDVYHSTDYWIPDLGRVPVVATLHDAIPLSHPEWAVPKQRTLKNAFMRLAARRIDRVITVSRSMVPIVVDQFKVPEDRVVAVHNGVGDEWFEPVPAGACEAVARRYSLPKRFFLAVGTLQPRKNLGRVVAAFRSLPAELRVECPLVIVGRPGWGVDDLMPALAAGVASGELRWLDWVAHDELRAIFAQGRALIFPSLYEGFGMPVVEAFAAGLPVLTSTVSALPEIAGDAAMQVDPTDTEAIREGMSMLATDDALCGRLAIAGRHRARDFSWRACARQVADVYRSLAH